MTSAAQIHGEQRNTRALKVTTPKGKVAPSQKVERKIFRNGFALKFVGYVEQVDMPIVDEVEEVASSSFAKAWQHFRESHRKRGH